MYIVRSRWSVYCEAEHTPSPLRDPLACLRGGKNGKLTPSKSRYSRRKVGRGKMNLPTPSTAVSNSTPPSLSPPPLVKLDSTVAPPLQKYTPYRFDARPGLPLVKFNLEIKPSEDSMNQQSASDSKGAGPLLLAAIESLGEGADVQSEQGGSSQDGLQRPSLSPNTHSANSSEKTSDTSVSGSRDVEADAITAG